MKLADLVKNMVKRHECKDCGNPWWFSTDNTWICSMCRKTHAKPTSEVVDERREQNQKGG